jgi:aryl-alcohol dehydrogenase-like predicted oxidoreductase
MLIRTLGRMNLQVSILSLGCGAAGGLMVRGSAADQERAVAHSMDCGVTYFDTALQYENGQLESNRGRAWLG